MTSHLTTDQGSLGAADPLCDTVDTAQLSARPGDRAAQLDVPCVPPGALASAHRRRPGRIRLGYERGMATAEYAVGILAAVALALVLLRIITDNSFFSRLLRIVLQILEKVGAMVGS